MEVHDLGHLLLLAAELALIYLAIRWAAGMMIASDVGAPVGKAVLNIVPK